MQQENVVIEVKKVTKKDYVVKFAQVILALIFTVNMASWWANILLFVLLVVYLVLTSQRRSWLAIIVMSLGLFGYLLTLISLFWGPELANIMMIPSGLFWLVVFVRHILFGLKEAWAWQKAKSTLKVKKVSKLKMAKVSKPKANVGFRDGLAALLIRVAQLISTIELEVREVDPEMEEGEFSVV